MREINLNKVSSNVVLLLHGSEGELPIFCLSLPCAGRIRGLFLFFMDDVAVWDPVEIPDVSVYGMLDPLLRVPLRLGPVLEQV